MLCRKMWTVASKGLMKMHLAVNKDFRQSTAKGNIYNKYFALR